MKEFWRLQSHVLLVVGICLLCFENLSLCWSLNDEGIALLRFKNKVVNDPYGALSNWKDEVGVENPCSWSGVDCLDEHVVALNLKDLCLSGSLAPDLGNLIHVKSIILRNNSFSGVIPGEIAGLKKLEVLDLGCNNFNGPLPSFVRNNFSFTIVLLDNNELLSNYAVLKEGGQQSSTKRMSFCNGKTVQWDGRQAQRAYPRKFLQELAPPGRNFQAEPPFVPFLPPIAQPPPTEAGKETPSPSPSPFLSPSPSSLMPLPSPSPSPTPSAAPVPPSPVPSPVESPRRSRHHKILILTTAIGGPILLLFLIIGIFICQSSRVVVVKPWATGLSGQLQRAFVTGVPKLKRSELEAACEDFSNVIGSSSICTIYKGTLSSGVEIAVASLAVASPKEWSKNLELQFRKKVDMLSKLNHKNFVNLLGYCEEEEPFTRMMVFEYAPNGMLFEHLHIKESEHLDWAMRLRIAMGMAYCLEYMHQLTPPITHRNLTSSSIYLTEDYAAKVADFALWEEVTSTELDSNQQANIYSFGVILFEMITGRLPYTVHDGSLEDWASDYIRGGTQPLREMVDPTLRSFDEEQLKNLGIVIKSCVNPDPRRRPTMREVALRLREITGIGPDGAIPRLSPLWWAELEILSTEAN